MYNLEAWTGHIDFHDASLEKDPKRRPWTLAFLPHYIIARTLQRQTGIKYSYYIKLVHCQNLFGSVNVPFPDLNPWTIGIYYRPRPLSLTTHSWRILQSLRSIRRFLPMHFDRPLDDKTKYTVITLTRISPIDPSLPRLHWP